VDFLVVSAWRPGKYWLMVGDSVSNGAYLLQVGIGNCSGLPDCEACRSARKTRSKMSVPYPRLLPHGKHLFPECELQVRDDFSCCGLVLRNLAEISFRTIVISAFRLRETAQKTVRPRPVRAMNFFDTFGYTVSYSHFADLQRDYKCGGEGQVPFIESQCSHAIIVGRLQVSCKPGCGNDIGELTQLVLGE